jgi:hypothetical protein
MIANNLENSSRKGKKPNNSSKQSNEEFIIEVERPGKKLNMQIIQEILESTGIKLDLNYGPFCVNPKAGRYVVRGIGDPVSVEKVKNIPGVRLYKDTRIYPV